jgi:hypothetical protein
MVDQIIVDSFLAEIEDGTLSLVELKKLRAETRDELLSGVQVTSTSFEGGATSALAGMSARDRLELLQTVITQSAGTDKNYGRTTADLSSNRTST